MQILDKRKALAIAPLFRLAFRGFFLFGSLLAMVAVPLWVLAIHGTFNGWQPVGGWLGWHQHEMVFAFAGAIITGFLLTAVQTWTGRPGLRGKPLAVLIALWLLGRFCWLLSAPLWLLIPINLLFMLLVIVSMAKALGAVKQTRNYPIVVVLVFFLLAETLNLYGLSMENPELQRQGALAAAWLIAGLMGLIGGRVIPFFTQKGLGRLAPAQTWPWLDWALLTVSLLIAVVEALGWATQAHLWIGGLFLLVTVAHSVRIWNWFDSGVLQVPLLWSLYLAYAWLIVACAGMALWHMGLLANPSPALHALTVGSIGGLILAMIARVSLGHTGRTLTLPKGFALAFIWLNLGAVARVFAVGYWYMPALNIAAVFWTLAFAQYVCCYGPMLCKTRADGHPG
ncbi:NnrS family protein [Pseudomonas sp.]|uniref:NnrS family protein n=1 Tax=Pseudomonas sp. TaxID=306 RepID=UPI003A98501B